MKQQSCMAVVAVLLCSLTLPCSGLAETGRPNIVWISLEDITPMMGCYGDKYARTPVFDKFAAQGIRYTHAHSVAPVCSISRSSIISGLYPTSLGTCSPSAKRRLRERNKHFEETGWLKHSIRHSHAAFGVPFSFNTVPATAPQACRLSRLELQLYRLDLSVSPIGKGEGDVRDTTFRIAGDPDRAVEEVASSSSLFICYAPLDLRASFHQVGE